MMAAVIREASLESTARLCLQKISELRNNKCLRYLSDPSVLFLFCGSDSVSGTKH